MDEDLQPLNIIYNTNIGIGKFIIYNTIFIFRRIFKWNLLVNVILFY